MKGIVVFGGYINALGIARVFGRVGIPVLNIDNHEYPLCRYSRYCHHISLRSSREAEVLQYLLSKIPEDYALIPTDERWVRFLSKNKSCLSSKFSVMVPDWNIAQICYDKGNSYDMARSLELPVPLTYSPSDVMNFPVFVKSALSYKGDEKMPRGYVVQALPDFEEKYAQLAKIVGEKNIMIQEIIGGGATHNYSFASLFMDGIFYGTFCSRKLKQYPLDFGTGCVVEPVHDKKIQRVLREYSYRFLRDIQYSGISEIEYMYDSRDDKFKFIEVNPRIWMQHGLAQACGVDLLRGMIQKEKTCEQNREDMIWIDEAGLIRVLLEEIKCRRFDIHDYLSYLRRKKVYGVCSFTDPLPLLAQVVNILRYAVER